MLRYVDITAPDINNGLGCRVTLWVSGCKFHCKGCHNAWTWKYDQGKFYGEELYKDLKYWLDKDYIAGLTLSGGDPLFQDKDTLADIIELLKWYKQEYPDKDIWIFSGYLYDHLVEHANDDEEYRLRMEILGLCDIFVEGPYIEALRDIAHVPFRGSTNQRLIDLNKTRKEGNVVLLEITMSQVKIDL